MKKITICLAVISLVFSCSKETNNTTDVTFDASGEHYLEYSDALEVANIYTNELDDFFYQKTQGTNQSDIDAKVLEEKFWNERGNYILSSTSKAMGLPEDIILVSSINKGGSVTSKESSDSEVYVLTDKQAQYANNLIVAAESENFEKLIQIKDKFKNDVNDFPELQIFNFGIALIENAEYSLNLKDNCDKVAAEAGTLSGIVGMISGAITGGLTGAVLGGVLTGGTLTVPAGSGGAMVGAVAGGVQGYASGYTLGWLGCKIFS